MLIVKFIHILHVHLLESITIILFISQQLQTPWQMMHIFCAEITYAESGESFVQVLLTSWQKEDPNVYKGVLPVTYWFLKITKVAKCI